MLTSASRPGDAARCRETGVAAHLLKPVKQSLLLDNIMNAVGSSVRPARAPTRTPNTGRLVSDGTPDRTLRILLAEDNPVNQKFALRAIEKAGHTVEIADDGALAVEAWQNGSFDVVLMDVQMPEMDGFEATAAIRELESASGRRTPIIAMTANAMKGDRERCIEAGMDGYVSKPVKRETLFAEIARVLPEVSTEDGAAP
jgi:two-component system sensor histidine kinase/response regulator